MDILDRVFGLTKKSAGVEVRLRPDDTYYYCSILEEKKQKILTTAQQEADSLNDLKIEKGLPLSVVITGKGILTRKIPYNPNTNEAELLNRVLPNAKFSDFYLLRTRNKNGEYFVSAARKEQINPILESLQKKGLFVINIFLGPLILEADLWADSDQPSAFSAGLYHVKIENNSIVQIENHPDKNSENDFAISFSAGLSFFIPETFQYGPVEITDIQKEEFKNKLWINKWFRITLISLFCLLLINYFLFDYYFKKQNEIRALISINEGQLTLLDTLQNQYERSKLALSGTGLNAENSSAYFLDRIAATVPDEITLTQMTIHPLKKGDEETDFFFERNHLLIQGNVENSIILNEWIKKLKTFSWSKSVTLISFTQDRIKENGKFSIEITIG